jgi:hypothetical protein
MKKLIVLAACMGASSLAFGQGLFNINTKSSIDGIDAPVTMQDGTKLDGADGWVAQAFVSDAEAGSYNPVGDVIGFRAGVAAGYLPSTAVDSGYAGGTTVWVQIGAWNTSAGASYADAEAAMGTIGKSMPVSVVVKETPDAPLNLVGLQGWQVVPGQVIPEPSTLALGLLGLIAFSARRRR